MMTTLETDRLILRGWQDEDAASLYKYASDERVAYNAGWIPHLDEGYSKAIIRTVFKKPETYAICLKGHRNEPIGNISLDIYGNENKKLGQCEGEIGFWIGYPHWGEGIAPEAVRELLRHGFEDLRLHQIYCGYFLGNHNSERVQEKCGFVFHHVEPHVKVLMLEEERVEYINAMSFERWKKLND